jgi:hypothetical protein
MATQLSTLDALYKTRFSDQEVLDLTYHGKPLWAMLNKLTNFTGDALKLPMVYSPPAGRSHAFANAQTNQGTGIAAEAFLLTRVKDYQLISLDGESIEASEGNEGAFLDMFEVHVEAGLRNLGRDLNKACYRDKGSNRGQFSSAAGSVLTLVNAKDVVFFEKGMVLNAGPNKDGTSLRTTPGTMIVQSVQRSAGTVTVDTPVGSLTLNDYLFADGDPGLGLSGLDDICPSSAPSATTFFGVDRTKDPERLGGIRADGFTSAGNFKGVPIEEALLNIFDIAYTYGESEGDVSLMHSLQFTEFVKGLSSKKEFENTMVGNVGFKTIPVAHAGGEAQVFGDHDCQFNTIWAFEKKVLGFHSLGMAPRPLNIKGTAKGGITIDPNADGIIMRLGWRGQIGCRGPSRIARGTIS